MKQLPSLKVMIAFSSFITGLFYQSCRVSNSLGSLEAASESEVTKADFTDDALAQNLSPSILSEKNPVVVQLFNWPFQKVADEIPGLAALGYTHIHVSPANLTVKTKQWWGRYQPVDYRIIGNVLGSETEFKNMNAVADRFRIKIIADVVLNHMADFATASQDFSAETTPDLEYPPREVQKKFGVGALFKTGDFHPKGCINNFNDRFQVVFSWLCDARASLPDLNLARATVLTSQRNYLSKLKSLGVDGFRFDAVKHMNVEYFPKLLDGIIPARDALVFGEIIASEHSFDSDLRPYLESTNLRFYDFPLLQRMVDSLRLGGDLGAGLKDTVSDKASLVNERAITFVMNHDLPTNGAAFKHLLLDPVDERLAYAFLFSRRDGIPYVYSDLGPDQETGLSMPQYERFHSQSFFKTMISFRGRNIGQPEDWFLQTPTALGFSRGSESAFVLNKSTDKLDLKGTRVLLRSGTYQNVLDGEDAAQKVVKPVKVVKGMITEGVLEGRRAAMLVKMEEVKM